ncbi:MAG: ACP S-malonyltransferase [Oscillospiraceae bacterium]|nr:ACP S-malonyltransferase [Oscillospiraceae bacterium]
MPVKKMLLFPGQGSQYAGMSEEIARSPSVRGCARDILGYDLAETVGKSGEAELSNTLLAQPAVFAASLAALEAFAGAISDYAVAGHSLGEYAALVACGVLDVENGFKAIKARSEIMAKSSNGGMSAVMGLKAGVIESVCAGINGVWPVNYNSPLQTVIAGTAEALPKAEGILREKGAKRIARLNVSAAFHSELMEDASEEFRAFAETLVFNEPKTDFYSNVTGAKMTDFSDMPSYLAAHMRSPVRFADELYAAKENGIDAFVEAGPGKTLTGLVRKTLGEAKG